MEVHTEEAVQARAKLIGTARDMLSGLIGFVIGARSISALCHTARLERDPDILPFVVIASETDALPFEASVKALWS